jgi:hypothetical protein
MIHLTRTLTIAILSTISLVSLAIEPCRIEITEKGTGWPVPLVELRTVNQIRFFSDNNGLIAMDAPELMSREVWFDILSPGYEIPRDGFGLRGLRLKPAPGKTLKIEVNRTSIAKRLGRVTGSGLFSESQNFGRELDWKESGVFGQDSVQNAVYHDKMFWVWGDTLISRYPLGIFDGTAATSDLTPLPSFTPPLKLALNYFTDANAAPRGIAPVGGEGPTWITGFVALPDKSGTQRLVASYMKIKPPLEIYRWGLCLWNDRTEKFEPLRVIWDKSEKSPKPPLVPEGHPSFWTDPSCKNWVLFGNPFPKLKCPATFEAWQNSSAWEPLTPQPTLKSANDSATVKPHSGSIAWNAFRNRWVTVFMENFGKPSAFGEIWYAEAGAPTGPWGPAVKILSHDNYTFYNPRLHPEFTPNNSPILIFEGTYTKDFADRPHPTPRYDYNQVMYRLDLDDPKLRPAHGK